MSQSQAASQRTIAVSGASGMVGTAVVARLEAAGTVVKRLVRRAPRDREREVQWDPAQGEIDLAGLAGIDGAIHLAGENISEGRWNDAKKQRIRESRVQGTTLLSETMAQLEPRPTTLVSASAIGYYGDRGETVMDEMSRAGEGYLVEVCKDWEAATMPARAADIRAVHARIGVVLDTKGGALAKMLTPFKLGLGGVIGPGTQYMSWIALADLAAALCYALDKVELAGPVNMVSPQPVTNREFTKTLGSVLHRPTFFPMPAFAARLAFGEMADELLLSSTRVAPKQLIAHGFEFQHPGLSGALKSILGE